MLTGPLSPGTPVLPVPCRSGLLQTAVAAVPLGRAVPRPRTPWGAGCLLSQAQPCHAGIVIPETSKRPHPLSGTSKRCTEEQMMFARAKGPVTQKVSFCLRFLHGELLPEAGSLLGHP